MKLQVILSSWLEKCKGKLEKRKTIFCFLLVQGVEESSIYASKGEMQESL